MRIQKRYPVAVGDPPRFKIVLVGCGGTGSFLALHLSRLAYHARDQYSTEVLLRFVDPDKVEMRNIGRQNFCPAEVGQNKARVLARRYSLAFGLEIDFAAEPFRRSHLINQSGFDVVVGAVDNADARKSIEAVVRRSYDQWWLDCGNFEHAGQVLFGNKDIKQPEINMGLCGDLPLPTVLHPELLEPEPEAEAGESCAELALVDAQSLMINQAVATYAAQYLYRLVITCDLDIYATYIDLMTGSARSLGISREVSEN
jgi:PRTRC genetic system ThiF family protein